MLSAKVKSKESVVSVQGSKQELWEVFDYWQEIVYPNWKTSGKMSDIVKSFDSSMNGNQIHFVVYDKQLKDAMNKTLEQFKIRLEL